MPSIRERNSSALAIKKGLYIRRGGGLRRETYALMEYLTHIFFLIIFWKNSTAIHPEIADTEIFRLGVGLVPTADPQRMKVGGNFGPLSCAHQGEIIILSSLATRNGLQAELTISASS